MQALVSFVGDCPDTEVLHDILELMCSLLHPHEPSQRPLLACLGDLGGVQLFMSLVQREQQSIRVLGLRIIAAFVPLPSPSLPLSPQTAGQSPCLQLHQYRMTLLISTVSEGCRLIHCRLTANSESALHSCLIEHCDDAFCCSACCFWLSAVFSVACGQGHEVRACCIKLQRVVMQHPKVKGLPTCHTTKADNQKQKMLHLQGQIAARFCFHITSSKPCISDAASLPS